VTNLRIVKFFLQLDMSVIFEKSKGNQAHEKYFVKRNLYSTGSFNPSILSLTSRVCGTYVTEPMQRMKRSDIRDALSSLKVTKHCQRCHRNINVKNCRFCGPFGTQSVSIMTYFLSALEFLMSLELIFRWRNFGRIICQKIF